MKRVVFNRVGDASEVVQIKDMETPEPQGRQVRIKILAANIIPADTMFIRGNYGIKPQFPNALGGFEGMGVVDAVGSDAELAVGDRVCFYTPQAGTWADFCLVDSSLCLAVPSHYEDAQAAQLFVNPFAAFGLIQESQVEAGEFLLVNAAASAVAKIIIQLATAKGIKVIGTIRREENSGEITDQLRVLGIFAIINTGTEDLAERVNEITGDRGVQGAIDAIGGAAGSAMLNCLAPGSNFQAYGELSEEPTSFSNMEFLFREVTIRGFVLGSWLGTEGNAEKARRVLDTYVAGGTLAIRVQETVPLTNISDALRKFQAPHRSGKIIVVP